MIVKINAKRQVTLPAYVLDALGAKSGDRIDLVQGPEGFVQRPQQIDSSRLAPLSGKLPGGEGSFDLESFRSKPIALAPHD